MTRELASNLNGGSAAVVDEVFAARIRRYRAEHMRYQADLGSEIAARARAHRIVMAPVSRATIRRWERGFPPNDLHAILISELLGVDVSELGTHVGHRLTPSRVRAVLDGSKIR